MIQEKCYIKIEVHKTLQLAKKNVTMTIATLKGVLTMLQIIETKKIHLEKGVVTSPVNSSNTETRKIKIGKRYFDTLDRSWLSLYFINKYGEFWPTLNLGMLHSK